MSKVKRCPCNGETLAKLVHPVILTVLAKQSAHGYQIARLASQTPILNGRKPDIAGIYHMLGKMEASGHVTAVSLTSDSGPSKKVYNITAKGRKCLMTWIKTLEQYGRSINSLLKIAEKALSQSKQRQGTIHRKK